MIDFNTDDYHLTLVGFIDKQAIVEIERKEDGQRWTFISPELLDPNADEVWK
jgi:hypothetical protein